MDLKNICKLSLCVFVAYLAAAANAAAESGPSIGLMGTFTGETATPGQNCRDGFEAARQIFAPGDQINGRPLRFFYGDTKGIPAVAVSEFQRLNSIEKVTAVINQRSQTTAAVNPLARQAGIAFLAVAGQSDVLISNPNAFRFWPSAKLEGKTLGGLFEQWSVKRVAIVSAEEEYTLSLRDSLHDELAGRGLSAVYDVTMLPADTDFTPVAAKLRSINPDLVICNLTIPQNGAFVKKIRELGVRSRIAGNYWVALPDFLTAAGTEQAEGVTVAAIDPDQDWLRQTYLKAGIAGPPTAVAATCLTALAGLLTAMKNAEDPADRSSVLKSMHRLSQIELPGETVSIAEREAVYNLKLRTFKGGRLTSQ